MRLIDWAKNYRDDLGFSVIPIPLGEKGPRIHWEKYQQRKPVDRELEDWFSDEESNIGIVCGEVSDNLVVLDFETPEVYNEFFSKHGELEEKTLVVRTGGGGYHVYLRTDKPVKSRKIMKPRLDLKAEGGQVVAPPSIHPNGNQYELVSEELQIGEVSADELNDTIRKKIPREKPPGRMPRRKKEPYRGSDPTCIKRALEGVEEGYRNETAFRLTCYWRNTRLLKRRTVHKKLTEWNEGENKPPLSSSELSRVYDSADQGNYQFGCPGMQEFCTEECPFYESKRSEEAEKTEKNLSETEPTVLGELAMEAKCVASAEESVRQPIDFHTLTGPIISFQLMGKDVSLGEHGLIGAASPELEIKRENVTYSIQIQRNENMRLEESTQSILAGIFLNVLNKGVLPSASSPEDFFQRIYEKVKYYWDHALEPRWRIVAALWIIGTYFHQAFDLYPIIILQGERESGKTTLLFIVKAFAWNPTPPSTALRPAPMFRKIESSRPTFLMDITKLSRMERTDVIDVCEAGLERGGTVPRCVGEKNEVREFEAYSPKVIATRSSLPFEAKAIKIITCQPRNKERFKDLANRRDLELPEDSDREGLKRQGILCFLKHWRKVREARKQVEQTDDLYGRRFRLWRPILTICSVFAPQYFDDILDLAEKDARERAPSDYIYEVENAVIACALDEQSILLKELTESVGDYLGDQNVHWRTVKSAMQNLGCIKRSRDTRAGKKFDLIVNVINQLAQTRGIVERKKKEKSDLTDYVEPELINAEGAAREHGVGPCPEGYCESCWDLGIRKKGVRKIRGEGRDVLLCRSCLKAAGAED